MRMGEFSCSLGANWSGGNYMVTASLFHFKPHVNFATLKIIGISDKSLHPGGDGKLMFNIYVSTLVLINSKKKKSFLKNIYFFLRLLKFFCLLFDDEFVPLKSLHKSVSDKPCNRQLSSPTSRFFHHESA